MANREENVILTTPYVLRDSFDGAETRSVEFCGLLDLERNI